MNASTIILKTSSAQEPAAAARETGQRGSRVGKSLWIAALLLLAGLSPKAFASDPVGIWAIVDKVVFEPSAENPERIQIWGIFSFAEGSGYNYKAPEGGYLYYELPAEKAEAARKQWKDLNEAAGKMHAIGFSHRYEQHKGKLRKAGEKPSNPDVYGIGFGLTKVEKEPKDYEALKRLFEAARSRKATS